MEVESMITVFAQIVAGFVVFAAIAGVALLFGQLRSTQVGAADHRTTGWRKW